jgi:hypothetical protein
MEETDLSVEPGNSTTVTARGIPSATGQICSSCGSSAPLPPGNSRFVYALGRVEARFPRLSAEKEYAQVSRRSDITGLTDREVLHSVLSKPENRYLARLCCWILKISGIETYILVPREASDLDLVINSLRPTPSMSDIDAVIGVMGPVAPADMCNGLQLPIVIVDQIYSFDRESLVRSIPRPENTAADKFHATSQELFDRIIQLVDNAGSVNAHRALNYLALRYPAIYAQTVTKYTENCSLSSVDVRPSSLNSRRDIVDVIFTYTNRSTDVKEKFFCRVDVSDQFPFLVTKMSPSYDKSGL